MAARKIQAKSSLADTPLIDKRVKKRTRAPKKPSIRQLYMEFRTKEFEMKLARRILLEAAGWLEFPNGSWHAPTTVQRYARGENGLRGYETTEQAVAALIYQLEAEKKVTTQW